MPTKNKQILGALLGLIVLVGIVCIYWPGDAVIPIPLAVIFGPFLTMKLGIAEGPLVLVICVALSLPLVWKPNLWTSLAAILSVVLWIWTGLATGYLLYA
jgi:hypothetical protein